MDNKVRNWIIWEVFWKSCERDGKEAIFIINNKRKTARLQSKLKQKTSNKETFEGLVVVKHRSNRLLISKVKNMDGTNIKDEDGNDKRSKTPKLGWPLTVEYGTGKNSQGIPVVACKAEPLDTFAVSGKVTTSSNLGCYSSTRVLDAERY